MAKQCSNGMANGIVWSGDQATLFVSESGKYRVWKIAVSADQVDVASHSALARVLFDNLPGYRPALRRLVLRIPRVLWKSPAPYGHVIAFSEDGAVVADRQDPTGNSAITTGATETAERLYIHTVNGKSLAWLTR